ncbi:hypothetical protein D3C79_762890 [compost metagenome]
MLCPLPFAWPCSLTLIKQGSLQHLGLNRATWHRVHEELDLFEHLEECLVVEWHLHVLHRLEAVLGTCAPTQLAAEDLLQHQRYLGRQATPDFADSQAHELSRPVHARQCTDGADQLLATRNRLGIGPQQFLLDSRLNLGLGIVERPHAIRYRQYPRLGLAQEEQGLADREQFTVQHWRLLMPAAKQLSAHHCIEHRHEMSGLAKQALSRLLLGMIFRPFTLTQAIADADARSEIAQAIAMAVAVVEIGFEKIHALLKGIRHEKIIGLDERHERRVYMLHREGVQCLVTRRCQLRLMVVIDL